VEIKMKKPNVEERVIYKNKTRSTTYLLIGLIVVAIFFSGFWYYSSIGTTNSAMVEPEQTTIPKPSQNYPTPTFSSPKPVELFKGAFATYYGETSLFGTTIAMHGREEISLLNSSHFELIDYIRIDSVLGTMFEQQNKTTISLDESDYSISDRVLLNITKQELSFQELGTRKCVICTYEYPTGGSMNGYVTIFFDADLKWPLKFTYETTMMGSNVKVELKLKESNIPTLQPNL
jgi:hypothetical protein